MKLSETNELSLILHFVRCEIIVDVCGLSVSSPTIYNLLWIKVFPKLNEWPDSSRKVSAIKKIKM